MPNRRAHDHLTDHNWQLEIEGVTQGAFAEVGGLDPKAPTVAFQDGEDIVLRKPASTPSAGRQVLVVTLSRGYINTDELWTWRKDEIAGKPSPRSGAIVLQDPAGRPRRYRFTGARPIALEGRGREVDELKLALQELEAG